MPTVNVRFLQSQDEKRKKVQAQQARDERLRTAREERLYEHETKQLATTEAGMDRRTQATGEFGLARQRLIGRGALQTGAQKAASDVDITGLAEKGAAERMQLGIAGTAALEKEKFGYKTVGQTQTAAINRAIAIQEEKNKAREFSRQLGGQAYLGGQSSKAAGQITAAGEHDIDYSGLKPFTKQASRSYQLTDPVYDDSPAKRLVEPRGVFEKTEGKFEYLRDKKSLQALIKRLEDDETAYQGLR